ncbi:MAG TPA: hypothetical protein DD611_00055 [Alphaproteobacteria bacterium]|nr:hypothetical protein [Alphaproteobacteria bacterium]
MSKLISDLETRLNATLLQRTPMGSLPTNATPEIYSAIETICNALNKIEQTTPEGELTGYISVMIAEGLVGSYILRELSRFYALYPKIRLDLLTNRQQNLSHIEVALVDSNSNYQIPGRTLFRLRTPAYFFTTQEYLDTHGVPRDMDDMLENFDLCMYQSYLNMPECSFIAKRARKLNTTTDSVGLIFRLIRDGDGIGLLPAWTVQQPPKLVRVPNIDFEYEHRMIAACSPKLIDTPKIRAFIRFLDDFCKKHNIPIERVY